MTDSQKAFILELTDLLEKHQIVLSFGEDGLVLMRNGEFDSWIQDNVARNMTPESLRKLVEQ